MVTDIDEIKAVFTQAIHEKHKIRVEYFSKSDDGYLIRKCAPLDYGPSRKAKEKNDRFHMWNYESDTGPHVMSLNPAQIKEVEVLPEVFNPGEFITWDTKKSPWFIPRDWGIYS